MIWSTRRRVSYCNGNKWNTEIKLVRARLKWVWPETVKQSKIELQSWVCTAPAHINNPHEKREQKPTLAKHSSRVQSDIRSVEREGDDYSRSLLWCIRLLSNEKHSKNKLKRSVSVTWSIRVYARSFIYYKLFVQNPNLASFTCHCYIVIDEISMLKQSNQKPNK